MPNIFPPLPAGTTSAVPLFRAALNNVTTVTLAVVDAIGNKNPLTQCPTIELLSPPTYINYVNMLESFVKIFRGYVPADAELPLFCHNAGKLAFTIYTNTTSSDTLMYLNQMLANCTSDAAAAMAASACEAAHTTTIALLSVVLTAAVILFLICGYLALPAPAKAYCREKVSSCSVFGGARQAATIIELADEPTQTERSERSPLISDKDGELVDYVSFGIV